MDSTANLGLALLVLICLGFVAGKAARLDGSARTPDWIRIFAGYVALPVLVFSVVTEAGAVSSSWLDFALAMVLATYLTFVAMFVVSVAVGRSRLLIATLQATAAGFGSIGFLGIPLSHTLFGTQAALAAIVVLVAARLTHAVLLPVLVLAARPQRPARALAQLLRATVFDPIVLAVPVALAVDALDFNLPETLAIVLDFLTVAAVPTALFAVAIDLAGRRIVQLGWEVPVVTCVKLVVGPFITYCVLLAIGDFEAVWIMAAMLASAMPTAVRTEVIARGAGVYTTGTADCIALSGRVGVATIALLVWLLDTGALPLTAAELFGG